MVRRAHDALPPPPYRHARGTVNMATADDGSAVRLCCADGPRATKLQSGAAARVVDAFWLGVAGERDSEAQTRAEALARHIPSREGSFGLHGGVCTVQRSILSASLIAPAIVAKRKSCETESPTKVSEHELVSDAANVAC